MVISKMNWKDVYFVILGNRIWIIFHNSNSNHLIYSWVLQSAQLSLFLDGCSGVLRVL